MKVIPEGDRGYVYNGRFTGPVQLEMIIEAAVPTDPDIARVHSECGAVTHWHSHPGGQILTLISGKGRVGNADGTFTDVAVGTFVETPPQEMHWHGADEGSDATWLAITWGVTDWTDRNPLATEEE